MLKSLKSFLFFFFLVISSTVFAQEVCRGTLGDPVINITFGTGPNFGPPVPSSKYDYIVGTPYDGQYTVASTTKGLIDTWFTIDDHTPGDIDGYMMVINADNKRGVFYETTITGLCPNTTYEFAAWIVNLLTYTSNDTKANVTFTIEDRAGVILKRYDTGIIPETRTPEWKQFSTLFTTGTESEIILKITNSGNGGNGNDIALDDITFRPCGPVITPNIDGAENKISICEGSTGIYKLGATVSDGYTNPAFRWQRLDGTTWSDIPSENAKEMNLSLTNAAIGVYQYRLLVAEQQNINAVNCRIASQPLTITVNPKLTTVASNSGKVCVGSTVQLFATEGETFAWTGPNGYTSTLKNPILTNIQSSSAGIYTVIATGNGCTAISTTEVTLEAPIIPENVNSVTKCEDEPVQLFVGGGTTYQWFPVDGLSASNIPNPITTTKKNTTYTITISNGICTTTTSITVNVIKNAVADAGKDLKTVSGQPVALNGKVSGDNVRYYWSPTDYLDNPNQLNTIARPPTDITYTLYAESDAGCLGSSDEVFIKVLPKIVIPNSFSPNGDGINDVWEIPAADAFPDAKIKVTNRYGTLVYENNGTYTSWDGKSQGKDLPSATYYYTIYLDKDFPIFSGWVFIVR